MNNELDVDLHEGDEVAVRGWSRRMVVVTCNLKSPTGEYYMHEGIVNPVCVEWQAPDGPVVEWFPPDAVTLVRRPTAAP